MGLIQILNQHVFPCFPHALSIVTLVLARARCCVSRSGLTSQCVRCRIRHLSDMLPACHRHYPGSDTTNQTATGAALASIHSTRSPSAAPLCTRSQVQTSLSRRISRKELVNHRIRCFLESPGPLLPSHSKTSHQAKRGPEQNSSLGCNAAPLGFEMLTPRIGLSLPYLQKQPRQLLRLAAGRERLHKRELN